MLKAAYLATPVVSGCLSAGELLHLQYQLIEKRERLNGTASPFMNSTSQLPKQRYLLMSQEE